MAATAPGATTLPALRTTIGIDLGGTKMTAGRVSADGRILEQRTVPRPQDPSAMAHAPIALASQLMADDVGAVGLGVAGFVTDEGVLVWGPNVVGEKVPYRDLMWERFGLPVTVDNDANFAALGEARLGAAQGYRHSIMITLGTGIGGGIIIDGDVFRGSGFAGEIGHIIVDVGGPQCTCGQRGCWETFASGRRLDQLARDIAARQPDGEVGRLASGGVPDGTHLTEAAIAGDESAIAAIREMADWLGIGIANLVVTLAPEVIVIGGGVSRAGDILLDPARAAATASIEGAAHRPETPIVGATLGANAGLIGAAIAAKETIDE